MILHSPLDKLGYNFPFPPFMRGSKKSVEIDAKGVGNSGQNRDEVRCVVICELLSRCKLHWMVRSCAFLVATVLN